MHIPAIILTLATENRTSGHAKLAHAQNDENKTFFGAWRESRFKIHEICTNRKTLTSARKKIL